LLYDLFLVRYQSLAFSTAEIEMARRCRQ